MEKNQQIGVLEQEMIEEVNSASEEGELDRHFCQDICKKYMSKVAELF